MYWLGYAKLESDQKEFPPEWSQKNQWSVHLFGDHYVLAEDRSNSLCTIVIIVT